MTMISADRVSKQHSLGSAEDHLNYNSNKTEAEQDQMRASHMRRNKAH